MLKTRRNKIIVELESDLPKLSMVVNVFLK